MDRKESCTVSFTALIWTMSKIISCFPSSIQPNPDVEPLLLPPCGLNMPLCDFFAELSLFVDLPFGVLFLCTHNASIGQVFRVGEDIGFPCPQPPLPHPHPHPTPHFFLDSVHIARSPIIGNCVTRESMTLLL